MEQSKLSNKKSVLLVSPDFLGLYEDIYQGLIGMGYHTEVIVTKTFKGDPFLICDKNSNKKDEDTLLKELENYWIGIYQSGEYSFNYDYLIAIDGTCLHPYLFKLLLKKNPNIKKINYLFDGVETVYRFDRSFDYFDKIYTFDLADSRKFKLFHLPIYWVDCDKKSTIERDIFAFGSYNTVRKNVFESIKRAIPSKKIVSYIKLYQPLPKGIVPSIKSHVKSLLMPKRSEMIIHKAMPTEEFRRMIVTSRIIVDTSNGFQDGLSARFMWALGLGRKIITNNRSAAEYDFYTKEQIYIIGFDSSNLSEFINADFEINVDIQKIVDNYRIDNWLRTLLNN